MSEGLHATAGRTAEQKIFLNRVGRIWLKAFFSTLRNVHVHEPGNQIFDEPINQLVDYGRQIIELEGQASFRAIEDQFFLNGLWIKPTISERDNLYGLADVFKKNGIGGVTVRPPLDGDTFRALLSVYRGAHSAPKDRVDEMNSGLSSAKIEGIEFHHTLNLQDNSPIELPLPPTVFTAVVAYAKTLLSLKEFLHAAPGEERVTTLRKAQRIICELVDLSDKYPRLFGLLSLLRSLDSYFIHHSANVFILSMLFGSFIGLNRKDLADLGMASLFFDVGKLKIPEEILNKPSKLTPEERELVNRHPIESAAMFLSLGYMNESVTERVLVAYQHHWATRAPEAYPKPRSNLEPSLFSEIVAICDRFDALATDKIYRKGLSPRQSLQVIAAESARGQYRKEIAEEFVRFLGPLPMGTWLELDEHREGFVAAAGALSTFPPLPIIYAPATSEWILPTSYDDFNGLTLKPIEYDSLRTKQTLATLFQLSEGSPLLKR